MKQYCYDLEATNQLFYGDTEECCDIINKGLLQLKNNYSLLKIIYFRKSH